MVDYPYGQCNRHIYEDLISIEDVRKIIKSTGLECNNEERLRADIGIEILVQKSYWKGKILPYSQKLKSKIKKIKNHKKESKEILDKQINHIQESMNILENISGALVFEGKSKEKDIKTTKLTLEKLLKSRISFKKEGLDSLDDEISRLSTEKYKNLTPQTVLIGDVMPQIYKCHFYKDWKFSRSIDGGDLRGSSVRFAQSILALLEIKRSGETIRRAYKKCQEVNL